MQFAYFYRVNYLTGKLMNKDQEGRCILMKIKWSFFIVGLILFLISLPIGTRMVMELIHKQKMNLQYQVTNVSKGFPPTESTFKFQGHMIEIEETINDHEGYIDPWDNRIVNADLSLKLDGVEIDTLKDYPVRADAEGLNRYYGEIAYLELVDKKVNETQFMILLKKTREFRKEMTNGDIVGWVPAEQLNYARYSLDKEGNLESKSFRFTERDALETELLNAGALAPYRVGYYTDAWEGYPSLFFPFSFPFGTWLVGFVLMVAFNPWKK